MFLNLIYPTFYQLLLSYYYPKQQLSAVDNDGKTAYDLAKAAGKTIVLGYLR